NILRDSPPRIARCFARHGNDPANLLRSRACDAVGRAIGGLCRQSGIGIRLAVVEVWDPLARSCRPPARLAKSDQGVGNGMVVPVRLTSPFPCRDTDNGGGSAGLAG